jgi:hypothetical protein
MESRKHMIINKPMINQSYTYKLIVLDTETGEEKEFLPIHIKEFQLKVYPNKNLLDDDIWNFIWDISNMNRKSKLIPMTEEEEYKNAGITKEEINKNK